MEKNRARRIVAALVIAHVALHAVALSVMLSRARPSGTCWLFDTILYALFMLGPSQGALLAMWVVFGGGKFVWRLLFVVLGTFLYLWCFFNADREWLSLSFVEIVMCGIILLMARLAGLRLVRYSDLRHASGPFQFSIRDMFIWTTAVAIVLSAWKCLPAETFAFLRRMIPDIIAVFLSFPLVGGVSIFSALGRRWILARIVLLPIAIFVAGLLLHMTIVGGFPLWHFVSLFALMALWIVVSLLVLRYAGYRLAWRPHSEKTVGAGVLLDATIRRYNSESS